MIMKDYVYIEMDIYIYIYDSGITKSWGEVTGVKKQGGWKELIESQREKALIRLTNKLFIFLVGVGRIKL